MLKFKPFISVIALFAILIATPQVRAGDLVVDVNADIDAFGHDQMSMTSLLSFQTNNALYTLPMFNAPVGDHTAYWDSMVEQYDSAGVNAIAVWLKGNNHEATFANFVTAVNKRGIAGKLKIMPFDDNPASWTAMWNYNNGRGYGYAQPFDVSNTANWTYVWDTNLKVFFQNVPDANRYKINGRPVYTIWSGAPLFVSNLNGNGSKLINYIRQQCQATFGFNPYIIVPREWIPNDPSSGAIGVVDAVYPWFTPVPGPAYKEWSTNTYNGVMMGCCVPQYHSSNLSDPNFSTRLIDPQHGNTLANGLNNTIGAGCALTFVEGFDDYWENTECWRAANIDASGNAIAYAQNYYDYPNQRINILRQHSNVPFPTNLKLEAESCDTFSGGIAFPGKPNYYRNGNIAIESTTDTGGGYDVCYGKTGEVLTWNNVPFPGQAHIYLRAATALSGKSMHLVIDGVRYPDVNIPNTGGWQNWATVDMGAYSVAVNSYHTVQLVWNVDDCNMNWLQLGSVSNVITDGVYKIVGKQTGNVINCVAGGTTSGTLIDQQVYTSANSQKWFIHYLGNGAYSIQNLNSTGLALTCAGNSPNDGTSIQLEAYTGASSQQWTVTYESNGYVYLSTAQAKANGAKDVLDGIGCSGGAGAKLDLWGWNGSPQPCQQEWSLQTAN